jgi:hypothetical protein
MVRRIPGLNLQQDENVPYGGVVERHDGVGVHHGLHHHPDGVGQDRLSVDRQEVEVTRVFRRLSEMSSRSRRRRIRRIGNGRNVVFDNLCRRYKTFGAYEPNLI